jgi:hypothetical protein
MAKVEVMILERSRPKLRREQVVVGVEIGERVAQVPDLAGKLGVMGQQVLVAEEAPANHGAGRPGGGIARLGR